MALKETHDPKRQNWVEGANRADADFPIQNFPYGVFGPERHVGVAIGALILDLTLLEAEGMLSPAPRKVFDQGELNPMMALPQAVWSKTRAAIAHLLDADSSTLRDKHGLRTRALVPQDGVALHLPIQVRSFTDFLHQNTTPPMSAQCSVAPTMRYRRTGCTYRSAITEVRRRARYRARRSTVRWAN